MVLTPNMDGCDDSEILKYRHEFPTAILISRFFFHCGPGDEVAKKNRLGLPICYAGGLIGMT